jgi:hypothetical protein
MRPTSAFILAAATLGVLSIASSTTSAQGQGLAVGRPEWVAAVRHDTSRPLREILPTPQVSTREDFEVKLAPPSGRNQNDPAVQQFAVAPIAASPGIGFDGVGEGNPQFSYNVNVAPPDTTGEAGLTQYVQWVNTSFAVFDKKTGTRLYGPAGGNTLWAGFGGDCQSRNDGDPIVQYDQLAHRWVMTQFSLRSGNYLQCVAVSATDDATGAWHRYAFSYSEFPDYPKLAVWPNAYVITFNMFGTNGGSFTGGRVCAYDRAKMLNGQAASQICYQIGYGSLLPSDLEGQALPPAGTPNYVLNRGTNSLNLWRLTPNFSSPGASTFVGPTSIPVSGFSAACSRSCIPQPGTSQKLDALGDRLMYRLSYRNLGTREAMVVNHSVVSGGVTTIRWYELDITNGVPSVRQQSTYAPGDGQHRWMGSAAMDASGDIAVGYSVGSGNLQASIRFAGRDVNDPLNSLSMEENMQSGAGSQTIGLSRWGDYSTIAVDPEDDCTFWFTSEYLQKSGTFNWSTRIGSFKFVSCGAPPSNDPNFSLAVDPSGQSITQGGSATFNVTLTPINNYSGSGSYSVSNLPAGAIGSFAPATFTNGSYATALTITTDETTSTGSFPITIEATDGNGGPSQSTVVTLNVEAPVASDFSVSVSPGNRVIKRGRSSSYTVTVTPSGNFTDAVALSVTGGPTSGVTYDFSQDTVTGGGSVTLQVSVASNAPKGTYTLVISGTTGSASRSASVGLKIQ